jgi:hypothetical protein
MEAMMARRSEPQTHQNGSIQLAAKAAVLCVSVFGASLMAPGRVEAQGHQQSALTVAAGFPGLTLQMSAQVRADVQSALQAMPNRELSLTYARIHAVFRSYLGNDDLSVARALIDYAALAETELARRGLPRPDGTEGAAEMNLAYELVL